MKKIKNKFFSLSLASQLYILLGFIFVLILLVIHPYINSKLEKIAEDQIYESISNKQDQLIDMVENVDGWIIQDRFKVGSLLKENNHLIHLLYYSDSGVVEGLTDYSISETWLLVNKVFDPLIQEMESTSKKSAQGVFLLNDKMNLYYIIKESHTKDGVFWISFEFNDIKAGPTSDLLKEIQNELINVLYFVIFTVALVLIVWIYTIIKPLKSIVTYIQAIKLSKKYYLDIERKDEIGEVGKALIDMECELQLQKELQEDLIHNISHDLKTPITIIKSYSESMKDDIYPYGDKDSSLDIVIENANRLEKKVKDFLLLNRLDYIKGQKICTECFQMNDLIYKILMEFEPIHSNIKFEYDLNEIYYIGDIEHWHSCITNILDNATRYAQSVIKISLNENGLVIYNDGKPMEDDVINDLFKPYKKGPKGNFGLGMSIVYKIVTMYGYSIKPENLADGVQFVIKKITKE